MSLIDCIDCWETPCMCGHDYEDWSIGRLQELIDVLSKIKIRKESVVDSVISYREELKNVNN